MASDRAWAPHPVRQMVRIAPGRLCAPLVGAAAAMWASTGGFTVALADKGGSYRTRARTMGGVTLGAASPSRRQGRRRRFRPSTRLRDRSAARSSARA